LRKTISKFDDTVMLHLMDAYCKPVYIHLKVHWTADEHDSEGSYPTQAMKDFMCSFE